MIDQETFERWVSEAREQSPEAVLAVPVSVRLLADQLTPVVAYRRLVAPDARDAPSFLFESVEQGDRVGRYSMMGVHPVVEVVARGREVTIDDRRAGEAQRRDLNDADPLMLLRELSRGIRLVRPEDPGASMLPTCPLGGWFGYASYDTVRYAEPESLDVSHAPPDDRELPDMHWGLYDGIVAFDHAAKVVDVVRLALVGPGDELWRRFAEARAGVEALAETIDRPSRAFSSGRMEGAVGRPVRGESNMTREAFCAMVDRAKAYIRAGDIFQVVLGQRFERTSPADPFDVYRALRAVNPSPYMVYMQARGCILAASSPEILCRVRHDDAGELVVTNRPLAGTRRRGATPEEDTALEAELLADEKERAEHVMLVDLGRNDVGRVARPGSVRIERIMDVERYSHVMHLSSTVTGIVRDGLDAWDALRAALPVGTISGAPKVRAMQIIDELEPHRRGPYGGGMGYAGLDGQMDIALALRTMVIPTRDAMATPPESRRWTYHLQAAAGIVADSKPEAEYDETVAKAAAMARAIDVAEGAFGATSFPPASAR